MQRIERYGVIALVLLLVTIAAVSFWDDGTGTKAAERGAQERQERLAQNTARNEAAKRHAQPTHNSLPKTAPSSSAPSKPTGRKAANNYGSNRVTQRPKQQTPSQPKPQPRDDFKALPANVVEGPGANEYDRKRPESNDVEFPDLGENPYRKGGGSARGRSGGGPSASDLADGGIVAPKGGGERPVSPKPKISPKASTYTVKSGDSLSAIASRELGSKDHMDQLMALNGITNPDLIYKGQVLQLPDGEDLGSSLRVVTTPGSKAIPPVGPAKGTYVVRGGEVLGVIAQRELGSASRYPEIVALNPGLDADRITEGMRLRMPADWNTNKAIASVETNRASRSTRRAPAKTNKVR